MKSGPAASLTLRPGDTPSGNEAVFGVKLTTNARLADVPPPQPTHRRTTSLWLHNALANWGKRRSLGRRNPAALTASAKLQAFFSVDKPHRSATRRTFFGRACYRRLQRVACAKGGKTSVRVAEAPATWCWRTTAVDNSHVEHRKIKPSQA